MPKFSHKKKKTFVKPAEAPELSPGFSMSPDAYGQVMAYLESRLGKHPQFDYELTDFHPDHTLALLDDDGKLMAYCSTIPSVPVASAFRKGRSAMRIGVLEVLEDHRGKGLGVRLVQEIAAIARRGGYKCVRTFAIDGAVGFYRKHGFVTDLSVRGQNTRLDL